MKTNELEDVRLKSQDRLLPPGKVEDIHSASSVVRVMPCGRSERVFPCGHLGGVRG